jgi:hypothetical protein
MTVGARAVDLAGQAGTVHDIAANGFGNQLPQNFDSKRHQQQA